MNKIKEIVRMRKSCLSQRRISRALKTSRCVIQKYLSIFKKAGLNYSDIKDLSDDTLINLLSLKRDKKSSENS